MGLLHQIETRVRQSTHWVLLTRKMRKKALNENCQFPLGLELAMLQQEKDFAVLATNTVGVLEDGLPTQNNSVLQ